MNGGLTETRDWLCLASFFKFRPLGFDGGGGGGGGGGAPRKSRLVHALTARAYVPNFVYNSEICFALIF